jgi:F-type H+-transporting ATPase subunit gamma
MATLREIRRRIGGVKSTQKITKAMKMVAAAKLRRAQDAVIAARPYAKAIRTLVGHLSNASSVSERPLFIVREVKKVAIIVITSDRGLCGSFNSNVIKKTIHHIEGSYNALNSSGNVQLFCIGKKGNDYFHKHHYSTISKYSGILHGLKYIDAQNLMGDVTTKFLNGEYDRVELIYNEFKSIIHQRIVIETLLPLSLENIRNITGNEATKQAIYYIYEPSLESILTVLLPKHLNFQLWHAMLESNASEQGARMTAMDSATSNAAELIRTLQLSYNKARQASITKELLEIVSGAEALRNE